MNERIRELANKAGLDTQHNGIVLTQNVNAAEAFVKFAELVIMECTKFLDEQSDRDDFVAKIAPLLRKNKEF